MSSGYAFLLYPCTWLSTHLHQGSAGFMHQKSMLPSLGSRQMSWISHSMPPLRGDWKAFNVLREEILKKIGGASKMVKAVKLAGCLSVASLSIGGTGM